MAITSNTVQEIAQLSRLHVDDDELASLTQSFNAILVLFEQLQSAPTDNVAPMANPLDATQPLRVDAVTESDQRDAMQAIAPAVEDGLYLVPRVVE